MLDIIRNLLPVDPEDVAAYQSVLPQRIHVIVKNDSGFLVAVVDEIENEVIPGLLITQAKTDAELIENVNQLVYSHVRMPRRIRPYYGNPFKPEGIKKQLAGELDFQRA